MKKLIILALLLLCYSTQLAANTNLLLNDQAIFRFAESLYKKKEYYRAVTEYKRLLHFFPKSSYGLRSKINIGRSYMAGGEKDQAIQYWQKLLSETDVPDNYKTVAQWHLALSWLDKDLEKPYAMRLENINQGMEEIRKIGLNHLEIGDAYHTWSHLPETEEKSPALAGSLSALIPGSGSLYADRPIEGVYSFFITGLFYWATMDAKRNENKPLTYFFGFFTLTFYGGNIYTAVNSAYKFNDRKKEEQLRSVREKHQLWFFPNP